jgi:hypothetical protein
LSSIIASRSSYPPLSGRHHSHTGSAFPPHVSHRKTERTNFSTPPAPTAEALSEKFLARGCRFRPKTARRNSRRTPHPHRQREHPCLAELEAYPDKVTELGGNIDIGFAFQPSEQAKSIRDDEVTDGRFLQADEVAVGFFVLSAPDLDTAVAIAKLNPSTKGGGVEVRELFGPPVE